MIKWEWKGQSINPGWCFYCEKHHSLHSDGKVPDCPQQAILQQAGRIAKLEAQVKAVKARRCYLPVITGKLYEMFVDTELMAGRDWSQDAVDFACILNKTLEHPND